MISRIPSRLAKQHQFTTIRPEIVLLGSNGRIIDEHDRLVGLLDAPLSQQSITWTSPFLNPFMHTSVMFRTDVIRDQFGGTMKPTGSRRITSFGRASLPNTRAQIFPSGSSATGTSQRRCQSPEGAGLCGGRPGLRTRGQARFWARSELNARPADRFIPRGLDPGNQAGVLEALRATCSRIGIREQAIFPAPLPCIT